jgi:hypothetical protein
VKEMLKELKREEAKQAFSRPSPAELFVRGGHKLPLSGPSEITV